MSNFTVKDVNPFPMFFINFDLLNNLNDYLLILKTWNPYYVNAISIHAKKTYIDPTKRQIIDSDKSTENNSCDDQSELFIHGALSSIMDLTNQE